MLKVQSGFMIEQIFVVFLTLTYHGNLQDVSTILELLSYDCERIAKLIAIIITILGQMYILPSRKRSGR